MNLSQFQSSGLFEATTNLFANLGIVLQTSTAEPISPENALQGFYKKDQSAFQKMESSWFIGLIQDETFSGMSSLFSGNETYQTALKEGTNRYNGLIVMAVQMNALPSRSELALITRAFNRLSGLMPIAVVFRYQNETGQTLISISIPERFVYKRKGLEGEKVGKVVILKDIAVENPHSGHLQILKDLNAKGVANYDALQEKWIGVLNVEILNKKFYSELFNWYLWALRHARFPQIRPEEDLIKDEQHQSESLIRLLTRILFVWFMKEKKLVNEEIFDPKALSKILKNFNPEDKEAKDYYPAILQNLFFATLNKPINERKARSNKYSPGEYSDPLLYRFGEKFKDEANYIRLFENIPFLNGGLFDCLDQKAEKDRGIPEIRLDGFTTSKDETKKSHLPDFLFFGEYKEVDLSEEYGDKKKARQTIHGLIDILNKFKFTIEENTPLEEDVALDPELLGKVFENLLASYNEETSTTARKQTGSFYTPREIVDYMVDESLLAYLNQHMNSIENQPEKNETRLRHLFSRTETGHQFTETEKHHLLKGINQCKILDPACGSGAFPMGVLQKLIFILQKVDPENKIWLDLVVQSFPAPMREQAKSKLLEENWNYVRKLGIIQECIYGVDIQPIATQIAKLRFFISLLVDQKEKTDKENRGFEALPNLDFKLVTANTLISAPKLQTEGTALFGSDADPFFISLENATSDYFNINKPEVKENKRKEIQALIHKECQRKESEVESRFKSDDVLLAERLKIKYQKEIAQKEQEIKLWRSYENLFKHESVGFFETRYFFPNVKDGFDVVIGNPPYSSKQSLMMKFIAESYSLVEYKCDPYAMFIESGLNLLNSRGHLCFITPLTWLSNHYYYKLRKFLIDNNLLRKLLIFDKAVFDSANVDNSVFLISKELRNEEFYWQKTSNNYISPSDFISSTTSSLKSNRYEINLSSNKNNADLMGKICENSFLLGEKYKISLGLKLAGNDNFISSFKSKNHPDPIFFGKNIGYYEKLEPDRFFDFQQAKIIGGTKKREIHIAKPKILIQAIRNLSLPRRIVATIDFEGNYFIGTVNALTPKNKNDSVDIYYLLALVNSNLLNFYFKNRFTTISLTAAFLGQLPIRNTDSEMQLKLGNWVKEIFKSKEITSKSDTSIQAQQIDALVYRLYGLSYEEVKMMDPEFWLREEEYNELSESSDPSAS